MDQNINISMGLVNAASPINRFNRRGKINMKPLITHRAPLDDILKATTFSAVKKDNCIKWVINY